MKDGRQAPVAASVLALALLVSGCLGGSPQVPRISVVPITDGQINAQPNWTVGWAFEVFESIGDHLTATLSADTPAGWTHHLLKESLTFEKANDRRVTFLLLDIPLDQANGSFEVRLHATIGADTAQAIAHVQVTRPTSNLLHNGTAVQMDYVGFLADNQVFDTSMWSVANSSGLDKWPDFKNSSATRNQPDYHTLPLTLGLRQVIPGWEIGLQNMSLAQSRALIIPPELAYGQFRDQSINLTQNLSIYNTTTIEKFRAYTGFEATENAQFVDPIYGWTIDIVNVDNTTQSVTFRNMPSPAAAYTPYGINATVSNISTASGTFEVHLTPSLDQSTSHLLDRGVVDTLNETAFNIHWQINHQQPLAPFTLYFLVYVRSAQG